MFCTRGGRACSKSQCEMGRARSSGSVSQPRGCPGWPGLLPPLCLWTWHWAPHPHRAMCPHSQKVGGITSVTSKSRQRFLVAGQWGKALKGLTRCQVQVPSRTSLCCGSVSGLCLQPRGSLFVPLLPCGCCHTRPGRLWGGCGCPGSGVTGCASVSHAQSWAESPPQWCEHQVRSFLRPTSW